MVSKINFLFFILILLFVAACATKDANQDEVISNDEWVELDEFHMVMAESFHPYRDSANLAPARALASEMAQLADQWSQAALPSKVDNEDTRQMLSSLKDATAAFSEMANSADDSALGEELTKLHDLFHGIQEAWYGGGSEHEHQEHH
ncbi:MAG: hypothetical protein HC811_09025 [Flammeovirgaceae bacterium]|nr:hypothetical protein [Flammeovirgaceae bacterium]